MTEPSLRLSGISKRYPGVQALREVSLECVAGEVHAVLGENGSGKSTLLKIASGALTADDGAVEILGNRLASADTSQAHRFGLATVYQDNSSCLSSPSPRTSISARWAKRCLTAGWRLGPRRSSRHTNSRWPAARASLISRLPNGSSWRW